ncbi:hypothetical protein PA598K_04303 [Paenibacillus sp. 598K]|nr:hypothetical protein PA598K_04303 [Paenibacillus sp. 598K]
MSLIWQSPLSLNGLHGRWVNNREETCTIREFLMKLYHSVIHLFKGCIINIVILKIVKSLEKTTVFPNFALTIFGKQVYNNSITAKVDIQISYRGERENE